MNAFISEHVPTVKVTDWLLRNDSYYTYFQGKFAYDGMANLYYMSEDILDGGKGGGGKKGGSATDGQEGKV